MINSSMLDALSGDGRRSRKTSEILARQLASYIADHNLPEGTRLPTEREMLESFKVGRTTLREALRLLETSGIITIRPGRTGGPTVRLPRASDLSEAMTLILQFEGASMSDIVSASEALEPLIARLAAERILEEDVDALQGTIDAMRAQDSRTALIREHKFFHETIAKISGNVVLRIFSDALTSILDSIPGDATPVARLTSQERKAIAASHELILESLKKHDPDAADEAMRSHHADARRIWSERANLHESLIRWIE